LNLLQELHRRRVFRTAGYYIIAAWVLLQVADVVFPGFGIPDSTIQVLVWAAFAGFPVALLFGWFFDLGPDGITRTQPAGFDDSETPIRLARRDWLLLLGIVAVFTVVAVGAGREAAERTRTAETAEDARAPAPVIESQTLENSIAVLPFDNVTPDPNNAYFCDGVADEILNSLGRFQQLNVIGRSSSFAFRYDRPPIPEMSSVLGAEFLLQGSVRISGRQLRISTQLLDARGVQVWSATFDRLMEDVFTLQSEIAEQVATVVVPQITGLAIAEPPDPEAYNAYLRGRDLLNRRDSERAVAFFREAIARDASFAAAYSELAIALQIGAPSREDLAEARALISTARELLPGQARAFAAEGLLYLSELEPERAEAPLRQALAQEPSMVDAMNWLSSALAGQGKSAESMTVLQRANQIDPLHPAIAANYGYALFAQGKDDEAVKVLRRLIDGPTKHLYAYGELSSHLVRTGQLAEAYALIGRSRREVGDEVGRYFQGEIEFILGRWERGDYWLNEIVRDAATSERETIRLWRPLLRSFSAILRGNFSQAMALIESHLKFIGKSLADAPEVFIQWFGGAPGLAGDCATSAQWLGEVFPADSRGDIEMANTLWIQGRAAHVLAWCQLQLGQVEAANDLLGAMEAGFQDKQTRREFISSTTWFIAARTAALSGNIDLAVDRLKQAVDQGWRSLNLHAHEPMWAELRRDPRVQPLLEQVRADIAEQRRLAQQMDTEWDPIEWDRQRRATAEQPD
jgi:TolB-like protein/Flp pilus assembly protein TadD